MSTEITTLAGRISLQVASESESTTGQFFSASFELKGNADIGELTLVSPIGNVLGVLRWKPGEASLDTGNGQPQRFESVESFLGQTTGAALPTAALFGWLQGQNPLVPGWTVDLSRHSEGRISAQRTQPRPLADLRVVLNP